MSESLLAGWFPDPFGRHEMRYWDGSLWTEHVATQGDQALDPPGAAPPVQTPPAPQTPSGWHPDPLDRHELRYWDGSRWTEHVSSRGHQGVDPFTEAPFVSIASVAARLPTGAAPARDTSRESKKVQKQVRKAGLVDGSGHSDLAILNEPVLVINQKGSSSSCAPSTPSTTRVGFSWPP